METSPLPTTRRGPGCHQSTQPAALLVPRTLAGGCPVRRPLLHKAAGTAACRGPCRSTGSWKPEKILLFLQPCPVPSTSPVVITQHRAIKAVGRRRGLAQAENSVFSPRMDGSPSIITKNEHKLIKRDIHTLKKKEKKGFREHISLSAVIKCSLPLECDKARQGHRTPTVGKCSEHRVISR